MHDGSVSGNLGRGGWIIAVIIVFFRLEHGEAIEEHDAASAVPQFQGTPYGVAVHRFAAPGNLVAEIETGNLVHKIVLTAGVARKDRQGKQPVLAHWRDILH
jgi:hypothetical protein